MGPLAGPQGPEVSRSSSRSGGTVAVAAGGFWLADLDGKHQSGPVSLSAGSPPTPPATPQKKSPDLTWSSPTQRMSLTFSVNLEVFVEMSYTASASDNSEMCLLCFHRRGFSVPQPNLQMTKVQWENQAVRCTTSSCAILNWLSSTGDWWTLPWTKLLSFIIIISFDYDIYLHYITNHILFSKCGHWIRAR